MYGFHHGRFITAFVFVCSLLPSVWPNLRRRVCQRCPRCRYSCLCSMHPPILSPKQSLVMTVRTCCSRVGVGVRGVRFNS